MSFYSSFKENSFFNLRAINIAFERFYGFEWFWCLGHIRLAWLTAEAFWLIADPPLHPLSLGQVRPFFPPGVLR